MRYFLVLGPTNSEGGPVVDRGGFGVQCRHRFAKSSVGDRFGFDDDRWISVW